MDNSTVELNSQIIGVVNLLGHSTLLDIQLLNHLVSQLSWPSNYSTIWSPNLLRHQTTHPIGTQSASHIQLRWTLNTLGHSTPLVTEQLLSLITIGHSTPLITQHPWTPIPPQNSTPWSRSLLGHSQALECLCYWILNTPWHLSHLQYLVTTLGHHQLIWSIRDTPAHIITHTPMDSTKIIPTHIVKKHSRHIITLTSTHIILLTSLTILTLLHFPMCHLTSTHTKQELTLLTINTSLTFRLYPLIPKQVSKPPLGHSPSSSPNTHPNFRSNSQPNSQQYTPTAHNMY